MSSRFESERRGIEISHSPLLGHSLNQQKTKLSIEGNKRTQPKNKKEQRKERRQQHVLETRLQDNQCRRILSIIKVYGGLFLGADCFNTEQYSTVPLLNPPTYSLSLRQQRLFKDLRQKF